MAMSIKILCSMSIKNTSWCYFLASNCAAEMIEVERHRKRRRRRKAMLILNLS